MIENKSVYEKDKQHTDDAYAERDAEDAYDRSQLKETLEQRETVRKHNEKVFEEYAADPLDIGTTPEEALMLQQHE